jgi:Transposase DDE domain
MIVASYELVACLIMTPGNVDDRTPVPDMVKNLRGKLFGDRGSISASLTQLLFEQGLHLITRLRKNMKDCLMRLSDKLLLRKRAIIESIIDQLKNISHIEHSRHRSPVNFVVHLLADFLPTVIKIKSLACTSTSVLCWLLDALRLSRTHVTLYGDTVILRLEDSEVRIFTPQKAIRRAQELVSEYLPEEKSLSEKLIAERRLED